MDGQESFHHTELGFLKEKAWFIFNIKLKLNERKGFTQPNENRNILGKDHSDRQLSSLKNLLTKYSEQIPDSDEIKAEFKLDSTNEVNEDPVIKQVLALMENVSEWGEPIIRGKQEFNDKTFYESLASQFKEKGTLSDRQVDSLKKMVARYYEQIPKFPELKDKYGLPAPRKSKPKQEKSTS